MNHQTSPQYINDDPAAALFRIRRDAFTDPAVLTGEHRKIFDRSWLYVGHVSEVPEKGSFVTRQVGGRPIILVRGRDDQVRVLLNACAHRGNAVCREKHGKASRFVCFYHAWTFDLDGRLASVPFDEAYGGAFDKNELPLSSPENVEIYRGLVFLRYENGPDDLIAYLGNAREQLDHFLDIAADDFEIVPGTQSYSMRANWKLLVENSMDVYHGFITHRRYFDQFAVDSGLERSDGVMKIVRDGNAGRGLALDNGHAVIEMPVPQLPIHLAGGDDALRERRTLEDKYGTERARELLDISRNLFIFPNLILVSNWRTIRTFYPLAPDYMEIDSWALLPRDDSPVLRRLRIDNFISFLGPAGFGTPDDVEALEGCQRGFKATPGGWSDISRGMAHVDQIASDEEQLRGFWRQWQSLMDDRASDAPGKVSLESQT